MILVEAVYGLSRLIFAPLEWAIKNLVDWAPSNKFKLFEGIAVIVAIFVFYIEFQIDRPKDRAVRVATLFAQLAQTRALPNDQGMGALRHTLILLISEGVSLEFQYLEGVNLRDLDLRKISFFRSNLRNARFEFSNLKNSILVSANLTKASLFGANLNNASLNYANLSSADLSGADLTNANLQGTNLSGAALFQTNLDGANLNDADISDVDFTEAKGLTNAQLRSACIRENGEFIKLPVNLKPPKKICPKR